MEHQEEQIASDADVHERDSGRRRPAHYSSQSEIDVELPELHYVPAEGPLGREHFEGNRDEQR